MEKLSNTEAELKKTLPIKKALLIKKTCNNDRAGTQKCSIKTVF